MHINHKNEMSSYSIPFVCIKGDWPLPFLKNFEQIYLYICDARQQNMDSVKLCISTYVFYSETWTVYYE